MKIRADDKTLKFSPAEFGKRAKPLEEKMLVYSRSIHTQSGKHIRELMTWETLLADLDRS